MTGNPLNVLFLCTGNTARSVLAEAILQKLGAGRFDAYSAGSHPKGIVNTFALKTLALHGYPVEGLRSKSWSEFAVSGAPHMHFIITVCDNAAGETCPIWPGKPATAHWGIEDPASVTGTDEDKQEAFAQAFAQMRMRIEAFTSLPLSDMNEAEIRAALASIGHLPGATRTAG